MQAIILGAPTLVAGPLVRRLRAEGYSVTLCGRSPLPQPFDVAWSALDVTAPGDWTAPEGSLVISSLPIWLLPPLIPRLKAARYLVAASSASAVCYADSPDPAEQDLSARLRISELRVIGAAAQVKLPFTILRPTMIYGGGVDANLSAILRFADRFGFFPLAGRAAGLRQPIHADDVAAAILAVPRFEQARDRIFDLGGGEVVRFRRMVEMVLEQAGRPVRLVSLPVPLLRTLYVLFGRSFRHRYSTAVFDRMNHDQAVKIDPARKAFGFAPRNLSLEPADIPPPQCRRLSVSEVVNRLTPAGWGRDASARYGG